MFAGTHKSFAGMSAGWKYHRQSEAFGDDYNVVYVTTDRHFGLVVGVPGYRSNGLGSIPGATRFSEK
jgi:hypothetical protein